MRFRFSSLSKKKTRISKIQTAKSDSRALVVALLRGALRMLRASTSKHWLAFTTKYVRTNVHILWKVINERVRFSPSSNVRTT